MFELPELPYAYGALAPHIGAEIMELHHSKHHQAYVDKLNAALGNMPDWHDKNIEQILTRLEELPENIRTAARNNGGGHYTHSLFWESLAPGGTPLEGELLDGINDKYGSLETFKEQFSAAALGVFGSGWAWLLPDLSISTTPNQDSPLSLDGVKPLLGLDVWEHAYYLDYKNKRPDYVAAWWNVVDWNKVSSRFASSTSQ